MTDTNTPGAIAAPTEDANRASNLLATANTVVPSVGAKDPLVDEWRAPTAWSIATAAWRRETVLGQLTDATGIDLANDAPDPSRPQFNPWAYAKARGHTELQPYLYKGFFDRVNSPEDFERLAEFTRRKVADLETLEKGGWAGVGLSMAASLLDITALLPFGLLSKGATASRAVNSLRVGGALAVASAGQEAVTATNDPTRTGTEVLLNIGLAGALGGGFGALEKVTAHPASRLHPEHPNNPLRLGVADSDPVIVTRPGQLPEEGVSIARAPTTGTAGAARVSADDTELAGGRALRGAMRAIGITPDTRLWRYQTKTREGLLKMLDVGGVLTRGNAKGETIGPTAEDLVMSDRYRVGWIKETLEVKWRKLNEEFGQSTVGTNLKDEAIKFGTPDFNRIPQNFFMEAVRRRLVAEDAAAQGSVGYGAQYQAWFGDELKRLGVPDSQARTVEKAVFDAAGVVRTDFFDPFAERLVKTGMIDADEVRKAYFPQMWNRDNIDANAEGFKRAMREWLSAKPADDWLADRGIDPKTFDGLEARQKDDLLREWRGDSENAMRDNAEQALEDAKAAYVKSTEEAEFVAFGKKVVDREKKGVSLNVVKAKVREQMTRHFAKRMETLHTNAQVLIEREGKLQTALTDIATARTRLESVDLGKDIDTRGANALEALRLKLDADARVREERIRLDNREAETHAALLRAQEAANKAKKALADATRDFEESAKAFGLRAREVERIIKQSAELAEARAKGDKLVDDVFDEAAERWRGAYNKLREAEEARRQIAAQAKLIGRGLSVVRAELRAAAKALRKAKSASKRIRESQPLDEYLDRLTEALRGDEPMPLGFTMTDRLGEAGRTQKRMFRLPPEAREKLEQAGFLHTDLIHVIDRYQGELSGRLALREVFGEDENLRGLVKEINDEYDAMIDKAAGLKLRTLEREKKLALDDVRGVRDRLVGRSRTGSQGAEGAVWFAQKLREIAYIRFVGGFSLAALGDLATAGLASRGFFKHVITKQGAINRLLKDAQVKPNARELRLALASFESAMHLSSALQSYGAAAARNELGIGAGTTRVVTSKIDRFAKTVAERANVWSGQAFITDRVRYVAGVAQLDNIRQWVAKYDALPAKYKADLASLGIDGPTARGLDHLFTKHGTVGDDYFDPGLLAWRKEADGDELRRRLEIAIQRTMRRASYMPGFGDTPLMMDNWMGSLLLQFQSFAIKFTSEFMFAGSQRLATVGDERLMSMLALAFGLAYVNTEIRAHMRGDNTETWSDGKWRSEILMRSGVLGWTQPYFDAGWKLFGDHVNDLAGMTILEPSSKYAQNSWVDSLMGPWLGTAKDLGALGSAAADGNTEQLRKKALTFMPLNQQIRIIGQTLGD
jgi:hypothetical protein